MRFGWLMALVAALALSSAAAQEAADWVDESGRISLSFTHLGWAAVPLTEEQRLSLPRYPQLIVAPAGTGHEGNFQDFGYCSVSSPLGDVRLSPFPELSPISQDQANSRLRTLMMWAPKAQEISVRVLNGVLVVSKDGKFDGEISMGRSFLLATPGGPLDYVVDCLVPTSDALAIEQARAVLDSLSISAAPGAPPTP